MRVWQDNMEHGTMPDAKPAACARVLCRTFLRVMLAVHVLLLCACTDSPLDPDKPVTLTMWHVYGAQARSPMNMLIDRFNQTVGKEQGIIINVTSVSSPGPSMTSSWRQPVRIREVKNCLTFSHATQKQWP